MIEKTLFGELLDGRAVTIYKIILPGGESAQFCDYGARLVSLKVTDGAGDVREVVCGFESVRTYELQTAYIGATVGRYANRIRNGEFTLLGKSVQVDRNDGNNHLHGGFSGFDRKIWTSFIEYDSASKVAIRFSYYSEPGEGGFPGNLFASVTYELTPGRLRLLYTAFSDDDTVCSMTNHSYFNLNGYPSEIYGHSLKINADTFSLTDAENIPRRHEAVDGNNFDFRIQRKVGSDYDHSFNIRSADDRNIKHAATLCSEDSLLVMDVLTTMPAVQLYTGIFLPELPGEVAERDGSRIKKGAYLCLETQYPPNCMNEPEYDAKPILRRGIERVWMTDYVFRRETR